MTRTSLDDALWASLMLTMQQIPHAWKRDEAALRRFVEAVLWIGRTGAPWRDLPGDLSRWPSVHHRFRRWSARGWWELVFEALRQALPADGLVPLDSTTCKAHRAASGAARSSAEAQCLGRCRNGLRSKSGELPGSTLRACSDGAGRILRFVPSPDQHSDLRNARSSSAASPRAMQRSTAAACWPGCAPRSRPRAAPSTRYPSSPWLTLRPWTWRSLPVVTKSRACSRS